MSCENWLLVGESPEVEVVYLIDTVEVPQGSEDFYCVDVIRRRLHEDSHAVFEDRYSCEHY